MAEEFDSVNDEIKNEAKKVWQTKKGKERFLYFADYYKVHFIIAVVAVAFIISFINWMANRKDSILQVLVINGKSVDECDYQKLIDDHESTQTYDEKKQELIIDPNYQIDVYANDQYSQTNVQKVFVNVAVGELDVMLCDEDFMRLARAQDCAYDLSDVLPDDMCKKYEDKLVWYDFPMEEVGIEGYEEEYKQDYEGRYEALSLDVSDFYKIKQYDIFPKGSGYVLIMANTANLERAIGFIEYLDTP